MDIQRVMCKIFSKKYNPENTIKIAVMLQIIDSGVVFCLKTTFTKNQFRKAVNTKDTRVVYAPATYPYFGIYIEFKIMLRKPPLNAIMEKYIVFLVYMTYFEYIDPIA